MSREQWDSIPDELQQRDRWICWKYVECDDRDKHKKMPVSPHDGSTRIDGTDPSNGTDIETAIATAETHDAVAGLGFILEPLVGVDLDDCRDPETGEIEPWARAIIDRFGSYTEVSPSGAGVHVYVIGEVPDGGNRSGDVEMYDSSRFFTVTGDRVSGRHSLSHPLPRPFERFTVSTLGVMQKGPQNPITPEHMRIEETQSVYPMLPPRMQGTASVTRNC